MKIAITGHTRGIGKYLFEYYTKKDHDVIGMSRSNGYDIKHNLDKIIDRSTEVDLFINNASCDNAQVNIVKSLCTKIPNIVTMSSMGTEFVDIYAKDYHYYKIDLDKKIQLLSMLPEVGNLLLLKISFAETSYSDKKLNRLDSDIVVPYKTIANAIDFWLENPTTSQINFAVKLTDYTINSAKTVTGKNQEVDSLVKKINNVLKD